MAGAGARTSSAGRPRASSPTSAAAGPSDLVQAADSLSFIETLTPSSAGSRAAARPRVRVAKLDFMWERIRVPPRGARAAALRGGARRVDEPVAVPARSMRRSGCAPLGATSAAVAGGTFVGVLAQTGSWRRGILGRSASPDWTHTSRAGRSDRCDGDPLRDRARAVVRDGWGALTRASAVANVRVRNAATSAACSPTPTTRATRRRCCSRSTRASRRGPARRARAPRRRAHPRALRDVDRARRADGPVRVPGRARPPTSSSARARARTGRASRWPRPEARASARSGHAAVGPESRPPAASATSRGAEIIRLRPPRQRRLPPAHGRRARAARAGGAARWMTAYRRRALQPGRCARRGCSPGSSARPTRTRACARSPRPSRRLRRAAPGGRPRAARYGCSSRTRPCSRAASRASSATRWRPWPPGHGDAQARPPSSGGLRGPLPDGRGRRPGRAARARRSSAARAAHLGLRPGRGNVLHTFRLLHGDARRPWTRRRSSSRRVGTAAAHTPPRAACGSPTGTTAA